MIKVMVLCKLQRIQRLNEIDFEWTFFSFLFSLIFGEGGTIGWEGSAIIRIYFASLLTLFSV